ncbi:MAG TPA: glycosyltransferase family 61 protein [Lacipirellulaceae bacterium]|jgi:capsular polysaccharide biosynthesis protein|nr:glycosyltransferase family 61 protein [Lacipirellulaceae bacterium]
MNQQGSSMPAVPADSRPFLTIADGCNSFPSPKHWFRLGKYLLPLGVGHSSLRRSRSPREQVSVAQLAADHAATVSLATLGRAEALDEYEYDCYAFGKRESRVLRRKFVAPPFVAEIRNGLSFGRHCCVIGPAGKAVRETGYHLDGEVIEDEAPLSRLRMRYWRKRWEGDVTSRPWLPPKQRIDGSVAVLNTQHSHNFYHWLCDILPRLAPLNWIGAQPDFYLVDCLTAFQREVLASVGIATNRLIQPHCRLLLEADRLLVPSLPTPACLRHVGTILSGQRRAIGRMGRRIYISRRNTGKRSFANEAEFEGLLESHGFEAHFLETYPLAKQAQLVSESSIIVAPHGAGLANLIFAQPGAQIIEIVQEGRYNAHLYPEKSRIFGLHHQQVIAKISGRKQVLTFSLDDFTAALVQAQRSSLRAAA